MINKTGLIQLTQRLIRIKSENPNGNEVEIAGFVEEYLNNLGLKTNICEFERNRPNIISVLENKNSEHSLLITPHLDTVPAGKNWTLDPFKAKIKDGRLYGLGATDCKCNLAISLEVIRSIIEDKRALNYNLIFAATADEESGSVLGLEPLLKKKILRADAAVVLDADDFHIVVAQKGLMHLKIKLKGKKAHGAYPWLGVNAIEKIVDIADKLREYKFCVTKNKYLRAPTINFGTIKGGDKVNVVADSCEFELDIRFLPGESSSRVLRDIKALVKKYNPNFEIEVEGIQEPFIINEKHYLVSQLCSAMRSAGIRPALKGSEGATTISFFDAQDIPSIATGFGSLGCAHIADEYVKVENLYKGALVLKEFLLNFKFNKSSAT
ncbi:MAG: M20 family metallopeptidase [Candidatus Omnitrophica bacterium]|nr:M20 family metallopeptidase [Candidatus Omnitrophota bacterium]